MPHLSSSLLRLPGASRRGRAIRSNLFYRFAVKKDFRSYPWRPTGFCASLTVPGPIDAMGCQKAIAQDITVKHGDNTLSLKENHSETYAEARELFENISALSCFFPT
ncbi:MAG: hypothetical protein LBK13_09360, partial [Spirochaetales bacterium]|nr:hypothetical protein [Spirochaetales bacterium]